jgi:hypothetical protein
VDFEIEGIAIVRNVGKYLPIDIATFQNISSHTVVICLSSHNGPYICISQDYNQGRILFVIDEP